ncbi:MAG: hypothetical protein JXB38_03645 [Anaerolineales bacterium]|nr:hypothetical protein [Anaerolineales bacterium]
MRKSKLLMCLGMLLVSSLACSLFTQTPTSTSTPIPTNAQPFPSDTLVPPTVPLASPTAIPTATETFTPIPSPTFEPAEILATFTAIAQAQNQLAAPVLEQPSYSEQIAGLRDFAWGLDNTFWVATDSTLYSNPDDPIDTGDWINDAVFVSPDGSIVASLNTQNSEVRFFDTASGAEQRTLPWYDPAGPVLYGVVFSADWSTMAWYIRGTVQLMDPATGMLGPTLRHEQFIDAVALSENGTRVVTFQGGGQVIFWSAQSGEELSHLQPSVPSYRGAISPDLGMAALTGEANAIVVWDIASAQPIYVFAGRGTEATSLAFSPDGGVLAAAFDDGSIQTWDLATGAALDSLGGYTGRIFKLSFSPYDPALAGQTTEGTIWLWRTAW